MKKLLFQEAKCERVITVFENLKRRWNDDN
jgi:hypothetical protein